VAGDVVRVGLLGHRQRVHVTAQQHRGAGLPAAEDGGDGGRGLAEGDLQRQALEGGEDGGLRLGEVESGLGDPVEFAAQCDQLGRDRGGLFPKVHVRSWGVLGARRLAGRQVR
jgi:hypothetical protein